MTVRREFHCIYLSDILSSIFLNQLSYTLLFSFRLWTAERWKWAALAKQSCTCVVIQRRPERTRKWLENSSVSIRKRKNSFFCASRTGFSRCSPLFFHVFVEYQNNGEGEVGNKTPCLPLLVELVLSLFETKMTAVCCLSAIATDTLNTPDGDRRQFHL